MKTFRVEWWVDYDDSDYDVDHHGITYIQAETRHDSKIAVEESISLIFNIKDKESFREFVTIESNELWGDEKIDPRILISMFKKAGIEAAQAMSIQILNDAFPDLEAKIYFISKSNDK